MQYNWVPVTGEFTEEKKKLIFQGKTVQYYKEQGKYDGPSIGKIFISPKFYEGTISSVVEFTKPNIDSVFEIIVFYSNESNNQKMLNAGLSGYSGMYRVRLLEGNQWKVLAASGDGQNFNKRKRYNLKISIKGSKLRIHVDDIDVLSLTLNFPVPQSQIGIWCQDYSDIIIHDFEVENREPKVFVAMEFNSPYVELYKNVFENVCKEFDLEPIKADDSYNLGLIISDIVDQISESKIIIAEITPNNPNVYYEVGYAHALNKPTILIAEKSTKLPFDISPFRVLFYENSIDGKGKVEEKLRKFLKEIINK